MAYCSKNAIGPRQNNFKTMNMINVDMIDAIHKMIQADFPAIVLRVTKSASSFADLGYKETEWKQLLKRSLSTFSVAVETIKAKHAQLAELVQVTPSEVRAFFIKQPTMLTFNLTSASSELRVQLCEEETGRPQQSILGIPHLFLSSLGRIATRLCYINEHGQTLSSTASELCLPLGKFRQLLCVSVEDYSEWRKHWLQTSKGKQYGMFSRAAGLCTSA